MNNTNLFPHYLPEVVVVVCNGAERPVDGAEGPLVDRPGAPLLRQFEVRTEPEKADRLPLTSLAT